MTNLTAQAYKQLEKISSNVGITESSIQILQIDASTIWFKAIKFGKYEEKFTVERTKTGQVKNGSIRFYE